MTQQHMNVPRRYSSIASQRGWPVRDTRVSRRRAAGRRNNTRVSRAIENRSYPILEYQKKWNIRVGTILEYRFARVLVRSGYSSISSTPKADPTRYSSIGSERF